MHGGGNGRKGGRTGPVALFVGVLLLSCVACGGDVEDALPSKLLIIGIDGGEWAVLDPLLEAGRTPHIARLIDEGCRARLETLEPTLSPAIWTTIATGKLPDSHGIHGFDGIPGTTMRTLPTTQMRRTKAFWNMASDCGRRVGVVSWWVTWPAEEVNGYMVSDRVTYTRMEAAIDGEKTTAYDTWPEELAGEIDPFIGKPWEITDEEVGRFMDLTGREIETQVRSAEYDMGRLLPEFKYAYQSDRSTARIARHLLQKEKVDLFALFFAQIDVVSHFFWHFMEPDRFAGVNVSDEDRRRFGRVIEESYVFIDELIGEIVEAAGEEYTVMVVSDHGFGPTGRLPWSGGHGKTTPGAPIAPDGMLVMSGPNVNRSASPGTAHALDILPTTLYLMGLPVGRDMEGSIMTGMVDRAFTKNMEVRYIESYDDESWIEGREEPMVSDPERDRAIIEKLKSLGYIR